jgi:hypothetical protein
LAMGIKEILIAIEENLRKAELVVVSILTFLFLVFVLTVRSVHGDKREGSRKASRTEKKKR